MKLLPAVVCLLVLVNVAGVESRGAPSQNKWSSLFVFGDDFVDNGNLDKLAPGQTPPASILQDTTRQWSYPYGSSTTGPTGRFSNDRNQADFIARMLGLNESPGAYMQSGLGPAGVNMAFGGSGVFNVTKTDNTTLMPFLDSQIIRFREMVGEGTISRQQLHRSVALVAISGNDYMNGAKVKDDFLGSSSDIYEYIQSVVSGIVMSVVHLQKLGFRKVLVNSMHPIGCTPFYTRSNHNTECDLMANYAASVHNDILQELMGEKHNAYIVDLYTAFTNIVNHAAGEGSEQFKHKLAPCCNRDYATGYCGQLNSGGEQLFSLCENPDQSFYWDEMNPTSAGWEAVVEALQEPIQEFLDRAYVSNES